MGLEIKKAHLQYVLTLMATPLKYPQFFYAQADIFFWFFKRLDEKTTYRAIKQKGDENIAPSSFGETVIKFSKSIFGDSKRTYPAQEKVIRQLHKNTFLNLAAWYLCPLIEANGRKCPYMPQDWILAFEKEKSELNKEDSQKYYATIIDFISSVQEEWWIRPYEDVEGPIGETARLMLLFLIGMFLEAYEEQKNQGALPPPKKSSEAAAINLSPEVIEFLEGLDLTDFPEKK